MHLSFNIYWLQNIQRINTFFSLISSVLPTVIRNISSIVVAISSTAYWSSGNFRSVLIVRVVLGCKISCWLITDSTMRIVFTIYDPVAIGIGVNAVWNKLTARINETWRRKTPAEELRSWINKTAYGKKNLEIKNAEPNFTLVFR